MTSQHACCCHLFPRVRPRARETRKVHDGLERVKPARLHSKLWCGRPAIVLMFTCADMHVWGTCVQCKCCVSVPFKPRLWRDMGASQLACTPASLGSQFPISQRFSFLPSSLPSSLASFIAAWNLEPHFGVAESFQFIIAHSFWIRARKAERQMETSSRKFPFKRLRGRNKSPLASSAVFFFSSFPWRLRRYHVGIVWETVLTTLWSECKVTRYN